MSGYALNPSGCGLVGQCVRQHRKKGQHLNGDMPRSCNCMPGMCACRGRDDRLGRLAHHGSPRAPGRPEHHGYGPGGISTALVGPSYGGIRASVLPPPTHDKPGRHLWIWTGQKYLHLEPRGQREIAPGKLVKYDGGRAPGGLSGRWHVTPPSLHVVHPPPPPRSRRAQVVPGISTHVAGHYHWSPVLKRHVWITSHDNLSLDPKTLPAAIRGPVMQAIKSSLGHTHAHTAWGVSGHRVWVIPGHWEHTKAGGWKYVERHVDTQGRPHRVEHAPAQAPSAAFGPRPAYLSPLEFWPHGGQFRDARNRTPSNAPSTVTMPPHAHYAQQNGLLPPVQNKWAANFTRRAFGEVNAATSQDVFGRPISGGLLRQAKRQGAIA